MSKTTGNGKLGKKLKCMIKRWHSSSRITQSTSAMQSDEDTLHSASFNGDEVPSGYRPVYVGKSRRRYLVPSNLVEHPVFQNLLERSESGDGNGGGEPMVVGCEVVLFEHLLWMLENADPKPESLDEIVEFYAC